MKLFLIFIFILCNIYGYSQKITNQFKQIKIGGKYYVQIDSSNNNHYGNLATELYVANYYAANPFHYLTNISNFISQGSNVVITGSGTLADPYIISSTGSGGSGSNSNVGSSFRWAIPNTQNIKTFANGYGFLLDSLTANTLTGKIDSAALFLAALRRKDSTVGGYYPYSSNPLNFVTSSVLSSTLSGYVQTSRAINTTNGITGGGALSGDLNLKADTLLLSTRDWRQKGIDSVTSLLSNYLLTSSFNSSFDTRLALKTTDNLTEGSTNKYYTSARSRGDISLNFTTSGTAGAATGFYNNSTGVFTLNVPQYSPDLSGYVPTSRTINGKLLSSNITLILASSDFANQGTTTTVLHGNASGSITFGQIVNADIANSTIDLTAKVTNSLPVANGGTGKSSLTAYAVLAGGTTSTGALQQVSGLGNSGDVLTSNGAGALPTWTTGADTIIIYNIGSGTRIGYGGSDTIYLKKFNAISPIVLTQNSDSSITFSHAASGVSAGSYTNANITVDANGHITAASNGSSSSTYDYTEPFFYRLNGVGLFNTANGGSNSSYTPTTAGAIGGFLAFTGTGTTGQITVSTADPSLYFDNTATTTHKVKWEGVKFTTTSATSAAILYIGFLDGNGAANTQPTDGCYFKYSDTLNSGNWILQCVQNGTATTTNTATAADGSVAHDYEVTVYQGTATFYIDGSSVGTISTNVPNGTARALDAGMNYIKQSGGADLFYSANRLKLAWH